MANNEIEAFFEAEAFFKAYNYLYPGNRIFYKTQTGKIREALVFNRTSSETLVNEDSNPKGLVYDAAFDTRMAKERKLMTFGNARTVRSVLEETIDSHIQKQGMK